MLDEHAISEALSGSMTRADGTIVYALRGEIDIGCAERLEGRILAATITTPGDVVLDMSEVTFIDSSGLAALINVREIVQIGGRRFTVVGAHGAVRRLFELVGVLDFFGGDTPG